MSKFKGCVLGIFFLPFLYFGLSADVHAQAEPKTIEEWRERFKRGDPSLHRIHPSKWPSKEELGDLIPPKDDTAEKAFLERAAKAEKMSADLLKQIKAGQANRGLVDFRKRHEKSILDPEVSKLAKRGQLLAASKLYHSRRLALASSDAERALILESRFDHVVLKQLASQELAWVERNLKSETHRGAALISLLDLVRLEGMEETSSSAAKLWAKTKSERWIREKLPAVKAVNAGRQK